MEIIENSYDILIRQKAKTARKIINFAVISMIALSVAYFAFWVVALADSVILDYMGKYFTPLAEFLNPNSSSPQIYQQTSFQIFAMILPLFATYFAIDKVEEKLIKTYYHQKEISNKEIKRQKQMREQILAQTNQGRFTICLSMNYKSEKNISPETKIKLNKAIFVKIQGVLSKFVNCVNVYDNKAVIIISNQYEKYDFIYSALLKTLATIKSSIEGRFDLSLIPSITTDVSKTLALSETVENHFEIQTFNLQNRAIVTSEFAKRYSNLKSKKYMSVPIGEFMSTTNQQTHELNLVYKDLNKVLISLNNPI
ncbi:MAG: hypothetical protein IJD57_00195 [Candidatus Gastranaerophilales bacterium]|nr:hypothetical protein [Candidatus Gastranaerophilales bacterium]